MRVVDLVYFDAGGGHRAAATALQAVITQQRRPWQVRLVDLAGVLDSNSVARRWFGVDGAELYNRRLRFGTAGLRHELKLLQFVIRLLHRPLLRRLTAHWLHSAPDLVVSLVPNFNRVLYESVRAASPTLSYVTVLTDMADHPPHFWIEPGQDQVFVCGTAHACEQVLQQGYSAAQLVRTSGMPLRPAFYDAPKSDMPRETRRAALGLDASRPTGVVMFGGQGARQMLHIAQELDDVQLILLCGHDEALARRLKALKRSAPHVALGFTEDVCGVMTLGDFFIGKPGPGCVSEAVQMGLPVIVLANRWTLPQERYNAQWVQEQGVGIAVASVRELPQAVQRLTQRLPQYRAATARIHNRAIFEIPQVFEDLLAQQPVVSSL